MTALWPADAFWMAAALRLARLGLGTTAPNPPVGAVVVRDGRAVGQGLHVRAGTPHAEVWALRQAGPGARGATLYVTLEPCCHHGRTPPCTDAILEAGIGRVVVATLDPNPQVHGRGVETLRRAGLDVEVGVLEAEAQRLLRGFATWVRERRPWVVLKAALTADGRIARPASRRLWITSERTRSWVHHLRATCDAVLVGTRTADLDVPDLRPRLPRLVPDKPVWRVFLDANLSLPPDHPVFRVAHPTIVFHDEARTPPAGTDAVRYEGVPTTAPGYLDLGAVLRRLADYDVHRLLVEGGSQVFSSFLAEGRVDEMWLFVAPTVFGDVHSLGLASRLDTLPTGPRRWRLRTLVPLDDDWLCVLERADIPWPTGD